MKAKKLYWLKAARAGDVKVSASPSKIMADLEKRGYVSRIAPFEDGRMQAVWRITESGRGYLSEV